MEIDKTQLSNNSSKQKYKYESSKPVQCIKTDLQISTSIFKIQPQFFFIPISISVSQYQVQKTVFKSESQFQLLMNSNVH